MKKLMIAAAIVCAAAFAQAGAVSWSISSVVDPTSGEDFSGGAAYLFLSSIDAGDVEAAILDGTFASVYASTASKAFESDAFDSGELSAMKTLTGLTGEYEFYSVVLDDASKPGYYFITDPIKDTLPSTSGAKPYSWEMTGSKSDWTAVPEPTSGLLLLLGVAGLALRRRA